MQGAAEWVLEKCTRTLNADGVVAALQPEHRTELTSAIANLASRGLRTLCLSYTDFPADGNPDDFLEKPYDENLIATCIVGIKVERSIETWSHWACKRDLLTTR